ncbi:MAG: sigma-70 family RNA polymerase sigma factor [Opitutae bacterium]|nr:sigma-70 family RNA polymerase sigma factor [Opitutae bacterium]
MNAIPTSSANSLADTLSVIDAVLAQLDRRLPAQVSREDLASAGKVALVEALRRFNGPRHEARAYCFIRVRGAVYDELRRLDPLSRRTRAQVNTVRRAAAALERDLGRSPTTAEVAAVTGMQDGKVRQLDRLALAAEPCSFHETDAEGRPLLELADNDAACPARSAETDDVASSVQAALDRLPANHAFVLRRYYLDDATLEEIADELGISKERVRQLRDAAEKKLRSDFIVLSLWQSFLAGDRAA